MEILGKYCNKRKILTRLTVKLIQENCNDRQLLSISSKTARQAHVHNVCFSGFHISVHIVQNLLVSLRLRVSDITLLWQVSQRSLPQHPSLSVSFLVSVCPPLSPLSLHFDIPIASALICLCLSGFFWLSLCLLHPWWFLMWLKSCEALYVYPLLMFFFSFNHWRAGSEKAVHLNIAGDGHYVPVNTWPLAFLSHLIFSSHSLCYSLLLFCKY